MKNLIPEDYLTEVAYCFDLDKEDVAYCVEESVDITDAYVSYWMTNRMEGNEE